MGNRTIDHPTVSKLGDKAVELLMKLGWKDQTELLLVGSRTTLSRCDKHYIKALQSSRSHRMAQSDSCWPLSATERSLQIPCIMSSKFSIVDF